MAGAAPLLKGLWLPRTPGSLSEQLRFWGSWARFSLCLQDYESIVKLVETLEKLPTFDPMAHPHVRFHYAFALNR